MSTSRVARSPIGAQALARLDDRLPGRTTILSSDDQGRRDAIHVTRMLAGGFSPGPIAAGERVASTPGRRHRNDRAHDTGLAEQLPPEDVPRCASPAADQRPWPHGLSPAPSTRRHLPLHSATRGQLAFAGPRPRQPTSCSQPAPIRLHRGRGDLDAPAGRLACEHEPLPGSWSSDPGLPGTSRILETDPAGCSCGPSCRDASEFALALTATGDAAGKRIARLPGLRRVSELERTVSSSVTTRGVAAEKRVRSESSRGVLNCSYLDARCSSVAIHPAR